MGCWYLGDCMFEFAGRMTAALLAKQSYSICFVNIGIIAICRGYKMEEIWGRAAPEDFFQFMPDDRWLWFLFIPEYFVWKFIVLHHDIHCTSLISTWYPWYPLTTGINEKWPCHWNYIEITGHKRAIYHLTLDDLQKMLWSEGMNSAFSMKERNFLLCMNH